MGRKKLVTELELANRKTRAVIEYGMAKEDISNSQLADFLCCSLRTIESRKKSPEKYTLEQIRVLVKLLNLDDMHVIELLGVRK